jgi:hypothetical protein
MLDPYPNGDMGRAKPAVELDITQGNYMTFFANEQRDLIAEVIQSLQMPEGVSIRITDFEKDHAAINDLPVDEDFDTILPVYGMVSDDCSDEISLVAIKDGKPVGQISASIEMTKGSFVEIDLWLAGIFVSNDERRNGIGSSLGKAVVDIMEAWRRKVASAAGKDLEGGIIVSGDTLPGSAGEAVQEMMEKYAENLAEQLDEQLALME